MLTPNYSYAQTTTTYGYDALGRLVTVAKAGGHTTTYTYDANDNRTQVAVVNGANAAPSAVADSRSMVKNTVLSFDPRTNDSDPNGDAITITAKTNGTNGTVAITGGGTGVSYTPTTNYTGGDSFTYTVSDGSLTGVGTVSVTVTATAPNGAPTAVNDSSSWPVMVGGGYPGYPTNRAIAVRANDTDPDSDPLTILSKTTPTNGAVATITSNVPLGQYIMVTNIPAAGTTFSYTISDGQGHTATATVTMTPTTVEYCEVC